MKKIVQTSKAPAPIGPYNQAVIVGDSVYISGTLAMDLQSNKLIKTTNIKEETKIVMDYIGAILKAADITFDHVLESLQALGVDSRFKPGFRQLVGHSEVARHPNGLRQFSRSNP